MWKSFPLTESKSTIHIYFLFSFLEGCCRMNVKKLKNKEVDLREEEGLKINSLLVYSYFSFKSILKSHNSLGNLENINSQREGIHHHFQQSSYRFNEFNFHCCWRKESKRRRKKLSRDKSEDWVVNKMLGGKLVELTFLSLLIFSIHNPQEC